MRRKSVLKVVIIILGIAFVCTVAVGFLFWNKPHRNVLDEKAIPITAEALFDSFSTDEAKANQMYLNKAIEVTGEISSIKKNISGNSVIILKTNDPFFGVNCTCKVEPGNIKPGNIISFKGLCTGYLSDVVLNEGMVTKK